MHPHLTQRSFCRIPGGRYAGLTAGLVLCLSAAVPAKPDLGEAAARYRQLSYKPVRNQVVDPAYIRRYVGKDVEKETSGPGSRRVELFLQHLGLLPRQARIRTVQKKLLESEVRGLYDTRTKTYYVVKGAGVGTAETAMVRVFQWMGLNLQDVLTVHELDHAIQDQHFNLSKLRKSVRGTLDRELALQALIEGDAMSVMMDYSFDLMGRLHERSRHDGEDQNLFTSAGVNAAPRFFRDSLSFAYFGGQMFVDTLREQDGWDLVNHAYRELPASTEQILHPAKYPQEKPLPVRLKLSAAKGYRSLGQDTAGELLIRTWGREHDVWRGLAAGWGGDRFEVFEGKHGSYVVWATRWDSVKDATEFADFARRTLPKARLQHRGDEVTLWIGAPAGV